MRKSSIFKGKALRRIADVLIAAAAAFAVGFSNVLLLTGFFDIPTGMFAQASARVNIPILSGLLDALGLGNRGIRVTETGSWLLPVLLFFFTLLLAAVTLLPKPGLWYAGLSLAGAGWIVWRRELLLTEFEDLFWFITRQGSVRRVLGSVLPGLRTAVTRKSNSVREALLLIGLVLALLTLILLMRRRNALWFSVLNILGTASLCVLMQTDPPGLPFLFLLAAHTALILTSCLRKRDPMTARRVLLYFAVPATVFCLLCGYAGSRYVRPEWADTAVSRIMDFANEQIRSARGRNGNSPTTAQTAVNELIGAYVWNSSPTFSYVALAGPQAESDVPVMEVYSDTTRTYYLRGMSYGWYDGTRWTAWKSVSGVRADALSTNAAPEAQLLVRTSRPTRVLYLPYTPTELPAGSSAYYDAYVQTQARVDHYSVLFKPNAYFAPVSPEYYNALRPAYTFVTDATAVELADIVSRFDPEDPNVVYEVASYVRNSATYDLNTERMPIGEDFVSWFLHDSETGYCVHFASAAAVLLRLLDIPARYVTGYLVNAVGGEWTTVTQSDAHAWVEYFDEGNASWRMLEVTSSVEIDEEEEETPTTPTAPLPNLRGDDNASSPDVRDEGTGANAPAVTRKRIPAAVWIALPLLAAAAAWPFVMRRIRRADFERGDINRRVIARYRYAAWLAKAMGTQVSAPVREAAERARFSRHASTDEDLALVVREADRLTEERRRTSNPLRLLWVRYFLAL